MSSIGPLWLGPTFVVAAAELTLPLARVAHGNLCAAAGGSASAGKVNDREIKENTFEGQECGA